MNDKEVETYMPLITSVVRRHVRGHHDIEDATQRALLTLFRWWDRFTGTAREPWITVVARNACRNYLISLRRHKTVALNAGNAPHTRTPDPTDVTETLARVKGYRCNAHQAEIVNLRFVHDMSLSEIAAALHKTESHIRNEFKVMEIPTNPLSNHSQARKKT